MFKLLVGLVADMKKQGLTEAAAMYVENLSASTADDRAALLALGQALAAHDFTDEARAQFEALLQDAPDSPEAAKAREALAELE